MYPLLRHGQIVVVEGVSYSFRPPHPGDVVLAHLRGRRVLKLVVAGPGEEVAVQDGKVWVGGRPLIWTGAQGGAPLGQRLGPHSYFLLSLAADVGSDSRHHGPITRADLLARALFSLWPPRLLGAPQVI